MSGGGRRRREAELDEELRFHVEMATAENLRRGMAPDEARRRALADLGGVEPVKEACRDERRGSRLEALGRDLRWGLRSLRRSPAYAVAAILTLALGIGATTAIFSLIAGILLAPLPYRDGEDLVVVRQQATRLDIENLQFAINEFYDYRDAARTLDLVEHHSMTFTLLGRGEPKRVSTGVVSWHFFDVLGVGMLHGRGFQPSDEDAGAEPVLVLSHPYWLEHFGGDPNVAGTVVEMNDKSHTVVGVLPPIPQFPQEHDVYMPTVACPFRAAGEAARVENRRAFANLTVFGRLRPGTSLAAADRELTGLAERLAAEHPDVYADAGYGTAAFPLRGELTENARPMLLLLLATTLLVLLIACSNVANLTLARNLRRERELAVRAAMGAGRWGLARQTLVESVVLGVSGGLLGIALAYGGVDLLARFLGRFTPRADSVAVDGWTLAFALAAGVGTGIAFGLVPAFWQRLDLARVLHQGARSSDGRGHRRLRLVLVGGQVALATTLLAGAGLMLRSVQALSEVDPGYATEDIVVGRIPLNWSKYADQETVSAFYGRLLPALEADPGVAQAALGTIAPLADEFTLTRRFTIEGRPVEDEALQPQLDQRAVSTGFFRLLDIPLVTGRLFDLRDDAAAPPVAIVSRSLAERHFGLDEALGQRLSLDGGDTWMTVVGIVGDVRTGSLDTAPADTLYQPLAQGGFVQRAFLRGRQPERLAETLRQAVWAIDPEQPVDDIRTLTETRRESIAPRRTTALLLGLFAAVALAITAAGLFSVVAYTVGQRTREIGLRMALGARREEVVRMVVRQGLAPVAVGLVVGLVGAAFLGAGLSDYLFAVGPRDPSALLAGAATLLAVAIVACLVPARRATRVDPVRALRVD